MLKSKQGFKAEFLTVIKNCKTLNIKSLYIHTRAFGETLYASDYFPTVASCQNYDYDIFNFMVQECHKAGLLVHAWINPYRVSAKTDVNSLNTQSPAYRWLEDNKDENDHNVAFANGVYFNPAGSEVRTLILDEIRELIARYNIDGIHFDDYFYPTQSADFDAAAYNNYKISAKSPLALDDWRRENVNLLISSVCGAVKYAKGDIVFSISPAADIDHNYNNLYADISLWIRAGWVDEIIPQLYFGFEYPDKSFRFETLLNDWIKLSEQNQNVKLLIGLASYKAKPTLQADKAEWQNNTDIIARQVSICDKNPYVKGYVYFSYSSLFGDNKPYILQRNNILEYLKQEK